MITQADIDAEKVSNTAIATGQDPQGVDITDTSGTAVDNDNDTEITVPKSGSFALAKTQLYKKTAKASVQFISDFISISPL